MDCFTALVKRQTVFLPCWWCWGPAAPSWVWRLTDGSHPWHQPTALLSFFPRPAPGLARHNITQHKHTVTNAPFGEKNLKKDCINHLFNWLFFCDLINKTLMSFYGPFGCSIKLLFQKWWDGCLIVVAWTMPKSIIVQCIAHYRRRAAGGAVPTLPGTSLNLTRSDVTRGRPRRRGGGADAAHYPAPD